MREGFRQRQSRAESSTAPDDVAIMGAWAESLCLCDRDARFSLMDFACYGRRMDRKVLRPEADGLVDVVACR